MEELQRALTGETSALERLVERLTPVVQARVARSLLRDGRARQSGSFRSVVEDLVQQVFVDLFDDDARVLRDWQAERGLSLENFVGLVAERRVCSTLRRTRRNPFTEEPTEVESMDRSSREASPERRTAARERLHQLLAGLRAELSPLGWRVFELLFLHEASVEEAGIQTGLSRDAIYAWRSRLRRLVQTLAQESESEVR